jgi:oxygen-independent coproporphyrinogen-3 oxidase
LPDQTPDQWHSDLHEAVQLQPEHISLYSLMLDGNTVMRREVEAGRITLPEDDVVGDMFGMGIDALNAAGLQQYEISNFARPGCECRHNQQYWNGGPYIGFGVGAHSFDGQKRWWNVKSLDAYHERAAVGASPVAESETLDAQQRLEEFVMLQLRLAEGLDLEQISSMLLPEARLQAFQRTAKALPDGLLDISENRLRLTRKGFLVADRIILELVNATGETP